MQENTVTFARKKQAGSDIDKAYSEEQCWACALGLGRERGQITAELPWEKGKVR